ncbi:MAG: DUF2508 family protein [bacterium]
MYKLRTWFEEIKERFQPFLVEKEVIKEQEEKGLNAEIKKAQKQWQQARDYFNNVSDPGLIDHASYKIEAAKAKYIYLLNKKKVHNSISTNQRR